MSHMRPRQGMFTSNELHRYSNSRSPIWSIFFDTREHIQTNFHGLTSRSRSQTPVGDRRTLLCRSPIVPVRRLATAATLVPFRECLIRLLDRHTGGPASQSKFKSRLSLVETAEKFIVAILATLMGGSWRKVFVFRNLVKEDFGFRRINGLWSWTHAGLFWVNRKVNLTKELIALRTNP